jgi:hypothetical protein
MHTCYYHADTEAPYYCQKDDNYMCEACAKCYTPRIYCQYRKLCPIFFLERERRAEELAVSVIDSH